MLQLSPFKSISLDESLLEHLLHEHRTITLPRMQRLWQYFRNDLPQPSTEGEGIAKAPAQRAGLPSRLRVNSDPRSERQMHREIVIENDIGWRIQTLVDFMFPQLPTIVSKASDPRLRETIEHILQSVLDANGGIRFWQDAALLGSVYGHIDLLLDCDALFAQQPIRRRVPTESDDLYDINFVQQSATAGAAAPNPSPPQLGHAADLSRIPLAEIHIEAVEAPRVIALVNENDYRRIDAFILHYEKPLPAVAEEKLLDRILRRHFASHASLKAARLTASVTEIHTAEWCQRYEDDQLISEQHHHLGHLPVVHIQNLSQPFCHAGLSDVEPLIPLQDELNTRLSDRANRVTMQSFRMWLGKGIDGFIDQPIGPGQMWMTDNEAASIEAFGGDAESPSERQHIEELREAMDKTSGVTPAAAGHINAKVGNLSSENAMRISLLGTMAKVKRKRLTYGKGLVELCQMILQALDASGHFPTDPADRNLEVVWPDPLPTDQTRRIEDAILKAKLGVDPAILRAELGYSDE